MTPIGVETSHRYVLVVHAPGCRRKIRRLSESRRPFRPIAPGDVLRIGKERLRVEWIEPRVTRRRNEIEFRLDVITSRIKTRAKKNRARTSRDGVIAMPVGESSIVADFLRCHVLVRVFGGDPEAWLEELRKRPSDDEVSGGDIRFIRWVRARLRHDPMLITAMRRMVESAPLWHEANG